MSSAGSKRLADCLRKLNVEAKKSVVVDANLGMAWVVDTSDPTRSECHKVLVGRASKGGTAGARLGNEQRSDGQGLTPPGLHFTFKKRDALGQFASFDDFVGLRGTNRYNDKSEERGILLHRCAGQSSTSGCVCFQDDAWPGIKNLLASQGDEEGTPVYIYANSMGTNDGCPDDSVARP